MIATPSCTTSDAIPGLTVRPGSPVAADLRHLRRVRLHDGDRDTERLRDPARGGEDPRSSGDRRDGHEDVLDVLDLQARLHGRPDVHEVAGRGRVDRDQGSDPNQDQRRRVELRASDRDRVDVRECLENRRLSDGHVRSRPARDRAVVCWVCRRAWQATGSRASSTSDDSRIQATASYATLPRTTVRRQRGADVPGERSGSPGVPERGSVLQAWMRSCGAWTTRSPAAHTASVAGAPSAIAPSPGRRAARQAPRVCAANAALALIRCSASVWNTAARTPSQGAKGVTGLSEPNASGTPAAASEANGFMRAARSAPRRAAYIPSGPPQAASNAGCTLATNPRSARRAMASASGVSTCSSRCPAARTAAMPARSAARRKPSRTASSPASPMTWKPAWRPAAVQATTWSRICSAVRYTCPWVSASMYGARKAAVREPTAPSALRSPARPATWTPSRARSSLASASPATSCPR